MTALRHAQTAQSSHRSPDPVPVADPMLGHLRDAARLARCTPHVDLFKACTALSTRSERAAQSAAEVLMRCLAQALGHRPAVLARHAQTASFDEAWLLALIRSLRDGDEASTTFLLRSRVARHARRALVVLVRAVLRDLGDTPQASSFLQQRAAGAPS